MIKTKQQIIEYLEDKNEDDIFEISKKQEKTIRSEAQNRYYWGFVVQTICDWNGDTPIEAHYGIKQTFKIETTTNLSTGEFKFIIDTIRELFERVYGLIIPLPKDIKEEESLFKYLGF